MQDYSTGVQDENQSGGEMALTWDRRRCGGFCPGWKLLHVATLKPTGWTPKVTLVPVRRPAVSLLFLTELKTPAEVRPISSLFLSFLCFF